MDARDTLEISGTGSTVVVVWTGRRGSWTIWLVGREESSSAGSSVAAVG